MAQKFSKDDLIARVLEFDNFETKAQAKRFVEDFFQIIQDQVADGKEVHIPGFGKFEKFTLASGVNKPKFRPFQAFAASVS